MKKLAILGIVALLLVMGLAIVAPAPVAAATTWYVDDDNCPGPGSGTQANPYCKIQDAIDAAAADDTIIVAAGTYGIAPIGEDLTIGKSLTLLGTQVGVDPRGGRVGAESEIVGVVEVTSGATYVVFDGFKFISPTRAFTPRGFNLRVESDSATIKNNIFVAQVNAGHTYSGYLDFEGISDALVERNSFSGDLDPVQEPNVIRLGISSGTVTVQNNEMHDVGGGGGIGLMADDASAVILIKGNEIENTGDGIWVWNPGGSTFDTLSIIDNNIYNQTKKGIKLVGPLNSGVAIHHNAVTNSTAEGISVDGDSASIHHNTVTGNSGDGISVAGDSDSIHHNTVTDNTGYGIHLSSGSDLSMVHHNTLSGNTAGNIQDDGANNKVFKNKFP